MSIRENMHLETYVLNEAISIEHGFNAEEVYMDFIIKFDKDGNEDRIDIFDVIVGDDDLKKPKDIVDRKGFEMWISVFMTDIAEYRSTESMFPMNKFVFREMGTENHHYVTLERFDPRYGIEGFYVYKDPDDEADDEIAVENGSSNTVFFYITNASDKFTIKMIKQGKSYILLDFEKTDKPITYFEFSDILINLREALKPFKIMKIEDDGAMRL